MIVHEMWRGPSSVSTTKTKETFRGSGGAYIDGSEVPKIFRHVTSRISQTPGLMLCTKMGTFRSLLSINGWSLVPEQVRV